MPVLREDFLPPLKDLASEETIENSFKRVNPFFLVI
jgi:hypothetical protein